MEILFHNSVLSLSLFFSTSPNIKDMTPILGPGKWVLFSYRRDKESLIPSNDENILSYSRSLKLVLIQLYYSERRNFSAGFYELSSVEKEMRLLPYSGRETTRSN